MLCVQCYVQCLCTVSCGPCQGHSGLPKICRHVTGIFVMLNIHQYVYYKHGYADCQHRHNLRAKGAIENRTLRNIRQQK